MKTYAKNSDDRNLLKMLKITQPFPIFRHYKNEIRIQHENKKTVLFQEEIRWITNET